MAEHLQNNSFVINLNSSIKEAMVSITDNQRGTVAVVDDDFYLQGIVADGDIRRAMLRGATMVTPIYKVLNANPVVLNKNDFEAGKAEEIFKEESSINVLPVVDESNKLIDVAIRSPQKKKGIVMAVWLLFALIAALSHSFLRPFFKKAVSLSRLPKPLIIFCASLFTSLILFPISFFNGFPEIGDKFLTAVLITGVLNIIAAFLFLRAYEISELSSVFPMLLLSPVFLIGTSYFILGEKVSTFGVIGIIVALLGLFIVERGASVILNGQNKSNIIKGALLGALVAFLFSISTNFDKMATLNSSAIFAGASVNFIIALGVLPILVYRSRKISFGEIDVKKLLPLFALGIFSASTSAFHNLALGIGMVSYTILIKRTSVLFGVLWGILFLKEKNFLPKIIGSLVAISGITLILLGN